jgi:hypothetical protein
MGESLLSSWSCAAYNQRPVDNGVCCRHRGGGGVEHATGVDGASVKWMSMVDAAAGEKRGETISGRDGVGSVVAGVLSSAGKAGFGRGVERDGLGLGRRRRTSHWQ